MASPVHLDPAAALRRLDEGNRRFVTGELLHPRRDIEHRVGLTREQRPYAAVLGCSDSRVPHEILFDEGLGDLFAVRVAGNTANDPLVVGSIEFAVTNLASSIVVVLGHEDCGAVKAAIDAVQHGSRPAGAIGTVIAPIVPIVESLIESTPGSELLGAVTRANVTRSMRELARSEPLAEATRRGALQIVGREYQLQSGLAVPVA